MATTYRLDRVTVRRGGRAVLDEVSLEIDEGTLLAIVGPNGAGKSTLLGVLAGDIEAEGTALLHDRAVSAWPAAELARERAVLLQKNAVSFAFTVDDVVAMGRAPWPAEPERDREAVDHAVARADIAHLRGRSAQALSGGEQARVALARVFAQQTPVILLDEPTAALDLRHQEDVLAHAADDARQGRTVVVVLHDLSLAAAYADRVALLDGGSLVAHGAPEQVLEAGRIAEVYGVAVDVIDGPDGRPLVVPRRRRG